MKKILAAIMTLCIVGGAMPAVYSGAPDCAVTAFAETDEEGNEYEKVVDGVLTYNVYADHAELTKCDESAEGDIVIPEKVKGAPVTSIGYSAFRFCTSISAITIPDSVTTIGEKVFSECTSLESITLGNSVTSISNYAFSECSSLKSIALGNSVNTIGDAAFHSCSSLTSIMISDSVTSIGEYVFSNCSSLKSVTISDSVKSIGDYAFAECEKLESISIINPNCDIYDSGSTICNGRDYGTIFFNGTIYGQLNSTAQAYANKYGYKFESIEKAPPFEGELKDGYLTYQVYKNHAELTKCDESAEGDIVIPEKVKGAPVTSIGYSAFRSCTSISAITIPDSVTSISSDAFNFCTSLTSITIPNSVTSIGGSAFEYCSNLKTITIPTSVTSISGLAFNGTPWLESKQKENPLVVVNGILIDGSTCSGAVDIPDSVKVIGHSAFWGCENITSVVIPDTVTIIDVQSFYNCTNLTSVTIPDSVRKINTFAFEGCKSLKSITLPASVNSIWFSAFVNCTSLTSATIMNPNCEIYDAPETFSNGTNELGYYFNGTISGYEGSTAQKYANKYGYKFQAINKSEEVVYPKTTEGFVTRMYNVALNRKPDAAGLKNWVTKLNNHTATAADIINGFFFSNEYQKKNRTANQMIEDCYKAMLDRSPDASGRANWKNRLSVGMSIQAICKGFVGSSEFKGLCDYYKITPGSITPKYARDENYERTYFIYRLYKNCLGRNPSASEVENWCKQIKAGKTGSSIAYGFIFSKEYKGKNVSNSAFVDMLYRTILGRNGDSSGVKSWTAKLNAKATRESVFNGFLFSTEFKNQCDKAGIKVGSKV